MLLNSVKSELSDVRSSRSHEMESKKKEEFKIGGDLTLQKGKGEVKDGKQVETFIFS